MRIIGFVVGLFLGEPVLFYSCCCFCFYCVCVLVLCFRATGYVLQFGEIIIIILYIFIDTFVGLCVYYSRPDITVSVDWA